MERSKVLKIRDRVLEGLLYYVAKHPELHENLILQGGGALHFIYSSPRYSEDIDFVCPDFRNKKDELVEKLNKEMRINKDIVYPSTLTSKDNFLRQSYHFKEANKPKGKIEIQEQIANEYKKTVGKFTPIQVETPNEIYSDKIIATFYRIQLRNSIKDTDIYDLNYILTVLNGNPTEQQIEKKAMDYNFYGLNGRNAQKIINFILNKENHEKFKRNLNRTLMPDVFSTLKINQEYFEKGAELFRKYLKI